MPSRHIRRDLESQNEIQTKFKKSKSFFIVNFFYVAILASFIIILYYVIYFSERIGELYIIENLKYSNKNNVKLKGNKLKKDRVNDEDIYNDKDRTKSYMTAQINIKNSVVSDYILQNDINKDIRNNINLPAEYDNQMGIFSFHIFVTASLIKKDFSGNQLFKYGPVPGFSALKLSSYTLICVYMDKIKITSNNSDFLYCSIKGGVIYILLKNKLFKGIIRNRCILPEDVNGDILCSNYTFQCTFSWSEVRKSNNNEKVPNKTEINKTLNEISTHI